MLQSAAARTCSGGRNSSPFATWWAMTATFPSRWRTWSWPLMQVSTPLSTLCVRPSASNFTLRRLYGNTSSVKTPVCTCLQTGVFDEGYDYIDIHIPNFDGMYTKRLKAYKHIRIYLLSISGHCSWGRLLGLLTAVNPFCSYSLWAGEGECVMKEKAFRLFICVVIVLHISLINARWPLGWDPNGHRLNDDLKGDWSWNSVHHFYVYYTLTALPLSR